MDKLDYFGDGMRWIVSVLIVVFSGCGMLDEYTLLDTAPQNESQLKHPEWAENRTQNLGYNALEGPSGQRRSDEFDSLARFLSLHGIDYEVIAGGHTMIKLKQKVSFKTGSASVSSMSKNWLNKLGVYLSAYSNVDIVIDGHTDDTGGIRLNDKLSQARASEVKSHLLDSSIQSSKIYTRGYGEYMPACNNSSQSGKACNRRVELTLILANN